MSQAAITKLVHDLDPLFESLVGGTPEDRAAIWGQAEQESNGDPAAIESPVPGRGGAGLFQHTGSRRVLLEAFAVTLRKPWSDPETQIRFVAQELGPGGAYAHAWHQISNVATTLQSKTETAMALFEAPKDWHTEIVNPGTTTANLPRRIRGAQWALAAIQQLKGKPVTDLSGIAPAPAAPVAAVSTAHKLAQFIEDHQIPAETVIRAFAVGNLGLAAPVVDGVFTFVNRFDMTDLVDLLERHPNGLQFLMELVQMFVKGRAVA